MDYKHNYSDTFYSYIERGSISSAKVILPLLKNSVDFTSVVDVGCGRGAWLSVFCEFGLTSIQGYDGAYVDVTNLLVDRKCFSPFDLGSRISSERKFDLVVSLEVAEHIAEDRADIFVDNLVCLGDVVMFSAAAVGQGGEFHVNEQPAAYWKEKFELRGFKCYDFVRPRILNDVRVMPWYRFNTFIYANETGVERLNSSVTSTLVPAGEAPRELFSFPWKVRLMIIKMLPPKWGTFLAEMNSKLRVFGHS